MITQTTDMKFVNFILSQPEIWSQVAPEGEPYFELPYDPTCIYLTNGRGVIIYHPFLDGYKIHPNFPKEHRGKAANRAIEESIEEMFSRGVRSIYAEIDVKLTHVVRLAKQLGFRPFTHPKWVTDRLLLVRHRLDS